MRKSILVAILALLAVFCVFSVAVANTAALPLESGTVNLLGDGGGCPGPGILDEPSIGDGGGCPGPG
ncbi:hypothetical protein J7K27_02350 [Candidatus Bathyarchaeota archaeon]|nr:hypothetical protein [Candidatus Bathyarchaeota archaeon]